VWASAKCNAGGEGASEPSNVLTGFLNTRGSESSSNKALRPNPAALFQGALTVRPRAAKELAFLAEPARRRGVRARREIQDAVQAQTGHGEDDIGGDAGASDRAVAPPEAPKGKGQRRLRLVAGRDRIPLLVQQVAERAAGCRQDLAHLRVRHEGGQDRVVGTQVPALRPGGGLGQWPTVHADDLPSPRNADEVFDELVHDRRVPRMRDRHLMASLPWELGGVKRGGESSWMPLADPLSGVPESPADSLWIPFLRLPYECACLPSGPE
jgi:hypothetical protein